MNGQVAAAATSQAVMPRSFIGKFTVLFGATRELWIVFAYTVLSNASYAMVNLTLTLWLSSDLGYRDVGSAWFVSSWSALMTLCIVLVGSLTDALGLRKTFLLGCTLCIVARLFMALTTARILALGCGLVLLALGEALGSPVTVAALRRYTTTAQRSIAFSMFYALMNAGFSIAGLLYDLLRQGLGEHGGVTLPGMGIHLTTYRTIFLLSLVFYALCLAMIYFWLREGVEATDQGVIVTPRVPRFPHAGMLRALGLTARGTARETVRIFAGLWGQTGFYKFLAFLSVAAFIKMIFVHMYYTYPKFGIRELGEGSPIGKLWALNSVLILFLVPLVGALTQRLAAYKMAIYGSAIASASVFVMAMPPRWFQPLADGWLGYGIGHALAVPGRLNPYYVMIFLYVILLSVGEAIYSPRLYEYAAAIAPKGQEASYMALSQVPMFLAKFLMVPLSGVWLERFCPKIGPRHSEWLWLSIALSTTVAPVGLFLLQPFIRVHEAGRAE